MRIFRTDPTPMTLFVLLVIGVLGAGAAGWIIGSLDGVVVGALLAAGIMTTTGLLGLLFGIPRVLTSEGSTPPSDLSDPNRPRYVANTNLEQVSDWLTKILIGATITQLGQVPGLVQRFVDYVGGAFGGDAAATGFVVAVLLLHGAGGFLTGYLWARLYLGRALREADGLFHAAARSFRFNRGDPDPAAGDPA